MPLAGTASWERSASACDCCFQIQLRSLLTQTPAAIVGQASAATSGFDNVGVRAAPYFSLKTTPPIVGGLCVVLAPLPPSAL